MAGNVDLIWGKREGIYFCERDWTGGISLKPKENFFSARMRRAIVALNASIKNATLVRKRGNFQRGLGRGVRAFSSEVDTGSREENASKQKIRARF